ncbi:MAG: AMP-binding protein, partial [Desulfobacula sp.]|nr:AMP-binding protein [Desulfobacula sp.]
MDIKVPGQQLCGYRVDKITSLENIDSELIQLEHIATKARHIHILNKDKENTFSVFFRTVPNDSSGVAHILEHTVLCGSKQFNVRDPFFSMIKRSLSTFMNAFTASDWTMYPFSTQNKKDYYNLMDVYLDAAFFPNIDELSFKQEGHRMEMIKEKGVDRLEYKGVVYNEMKGAMSSPDQVMSRSLLTALYPDTTYQHNSGGEPCDIPKLTWEALKQFHATYYHPSNAQFYTYGNLPLDETLAFINENVLSRFKAITIDSKVPSQPRWKSPVTITRAYAYDDPTDAQKKYQACVAWLTCDVKDTFEILALTILEQILIGNSASPLRKALIDSNLGTALSDSTGFEPDNRDAMFACGLKDISKKDVQEVENIIFKTLNNLVDKGIEKEAIASAIHQIEFHRKEITNTPYPYGIKLLLAFAGTVIHDGDPVACINLDNDLNRLKEEIQKGPFLEKKLKQYLIDNPHRVLFTLEPDETLETKAIEDTKAELKTRLEKMTDQDLDQIKKDAKTLEELQEKKEDLSSLPTLELTDVPAQIEIVKNDQLSGVSLSTCYDKATSGILYFTCPMGAATIPAELFSLVPFFCRAFTNCGTKENNYETLAKLMELYTGGISNAQELNLRDGTVYLHAAPMFHIADLIWFAALTFVAGTHVVIPMFTPDATLEAIETHRPSYVLLVPVMLQMVMQSPKLAQTDISSLERIVYGASPITESALVQAFDLFPNVSFLQAFGQTELSPVATFLGTEYHVLEGPKSGKLRSAGRATKIVEIRIVEQDNADLPQGEIGQIAV